MLYALTLPLEIDIAMALVASGRFDNYAQALSPYVLFWIAHSSLNTIDQCDGLMRRITRLAAELSM